jgi:hypothetical protein
MPSTLVKLTLAARPDGERRGVRLDPWCTISGWLWTAYLASVVALVLWLCR